MQLDSCNSRSSILGPAAAACTCTLSGPMYSAPEAQAASARAAHSHTDSTICRDADLPPGLVSRMVT